MEIAPVLPISGQNFVVIFRGIFENVPRYFTFFIYFLTSRSYGRANVLVATCDTVRSCGPMRIHQWPP